MCDMSKPRTPKSTLPNGYEVEVEMVVDQEVGEMYPVLKISFMEKIIIRKPIPNLYRDPLEYAKELINKHQIELRNETIKKILQ